MKRNDLPTPIPHPTAHAAWAAFLALVDAGQSVRRDLLDRRRAQSVNDWYEVWLVFLAGWDAKSKRR